MPAVPRTSPAVGPVSRPKYSSRPEAERPREDGQRPISAEDGEPKWLRPARDDTGFQRPVAKQCKARSGESQSPQCTKAMTSVTPRCQKIALAMVAAHHTYTLITKPRPKGRSERMISVARLFSSFGAKFSSFWGQIGAKPKKSYNRGARPF